MSEKIIIAVDFGTTYSAIGYTRYGGTDPTSGKQYVVDSGWPNQGRRASPKVPSIFKMEDGEFKYGFQVLDDDDRVAFAKLFLDPYQIEQATELGRLGNSRAVRTTERLTDGVAKYLKALKTRALEHMVDTTKWSQNFVGTAPKEYILSIPAIWSDHARARTLQCAHQAGFGSPLGDSGPTIRLVAEPEAAARHTITTQSTTRFHIDDIFIVCDAGGGTVDLSTYVISKLAPTLEINEVTSSDGDLCGSVFLNSAFIKLVQRKVGAVLSGQTLHNIKPHFNGEESEDDIDAVYVDDTLPNKPDEGFENGYLVITIEEWRSIFDPIINRVLILVTQRVDSILELNHTRRIPIFLVGGFGSSKYLYRRIQDEFPTSDVIQPEDSWSAVVKGALLRGMINTRRIRSAYGVAMRILWTPAMDALGEEFKRLNQSKDAYENRLYCSNCVRWYVKKGQEFSETKTVSFPYYRNVGLGHPMTFTDKLYVYMEGIDGDEGPTHKDEDCLPLLELTTDVNSKVGNLREKLEASGKKKRSASGGWYYQVDYELVMTFDTMIHFHLKYDGEVVGTVESKLLDPVLRAGIRV